MCAALVLATSVIGAPITASANTSQMTYQLGALIENPKIYIDFWGADWDGRIDQNGYATWTAMNYVTTFFQNVGGSPWLSTITQYTDAQGNHITNPTGQFKGSWVDDVNPVPGTVSKGAVASEVSAHAAPHFGDYSFAPDAVFLVLTGPTVSAGCGGYHDSTTVLLGTRPAYTYAYAFMPWCPVHLVNSWSGDSFGHGYFDFYSVGGGHEYAEALTDPEPGGLPAGWYTILYCGGLPCDSEEIGDKCTSASGEGNMYNDAWFGTQFFGVQGLWSNNSRGCTMGPGWQLIDRLLPNGVLHPGQELVSLPSNRYRLIMQGDGNLVLYSPTTYLWNTVTQNHPGAYAILQGADGNFVVYTSANAPLWQSRTTGHPGDLLIMQDDGNAVIYTSAGPIWQTHTCCNKP